MGFMYAYTENGIVMKIKLINWPILHIWHIVKIQYVVAELVKMHIPP